MMTLVERLEQATEGSRELDARAMCAAEHVDFIQWDGAGCVWRDGCIRHTTDKEIPHYTTSLDAALSLVPEGWTWGICKQRHYYGRGWENNAGRIVCSAEVRPDVTPVPSHQICEAEAATPALALCIASLKAQELGMGREMKPGDDLSYYLGPSAKSATQEQCEELEKMLAEAEATVTPIRRGK